jgi:hypothetical protein
MDGVGGSTVIKALGPKASGIVMATGGFRPNAGGAISVTRGTLKGAFTVAYAATGLYTVTLTATGWKFPTGQLPLIQAWGTMVDVTNTNRFGVHNKGIYVNATRSFVLSALQDALTAFAVPSNADNWIDFVLYGVAR